MMRGQLEICCGDLESVRAAVAGGADRVELCSGLAVGGLTPSIAMIKAAVAVSGNVAVHVLIRPREGDFLYSPDEIAIMLDDIIAAREAGAHGVVVGALNSDGTINRAVCRMMKDMAGDISITFHRAFDLCLDRAVALQQLIESGYNRILTSGGAESALAGAEELRRLNNLTSDKIIILGGCGVTPENAAEILHLTGLRELHASARSAIKSDMDFIVNGVAMGNGSESEYSRMSTDIKKVKQLATILHNIN